MTLTPCRNRACFVLAQGDLQGIQNLLNSSEASLHQLTALLDCRGLNKVRPRPSPLLTSRGSGPAGRPALRRAVNHVNKGSSGGGRC